MDSHPAGDTTQGNIAIIGGGPSGLVLAAALARGGISTTIFERDQHPEVAPRFNPDRSYTIDISGHGLKAIRHIEAEPYFNERMIQFKGLKLPGGVTEPWDLPGWTGSRGDILRALTTEHKSLPNWCTMIELDRVGDQLDKNYLHGLSTFPFVAAGAIKGDAGSNTPRWFCAIGTNEKKTYASADEAGEFFRKHVPRILELTSDEKIAAYAARTCYHIGQKLTCSQLYGGKAVLIGDSAGPFPPIGQGVNSAMESAMVLGICIGESGASPVGLIAAARHYNGRWKPEVDAVSWMSEKSLFENKWHMIRASLASKLGISIFSQAKSAEVPYSAVKRKADRLAFLWR